MVKTKKRLSLERAVSRAIWKARARRCHPRLAIRPGRRGACAARDPGVPSECRRLHTLRRPDTGRPREPRIRSGAHQFPAAHAFYRDTAPSLSSFDARSDRAVRSIQVRPDSQPVAKGVLTGPDQVHIAYVHSPMRYAWDL